MNTIKVIQQIAREMLRVLHNELNFIGNINKQYDKEWSGKGGAKIGSQLQIRLPNKFVASDGRVYQGQNVEEETVTITRATQKHIGVGFTSEELTQHIDQSGVRERVIIPAMAQLASVMEADAFSMVKDVYNTVGTPGTTPQTMKVILQAQQRLNEFLAPRDRTRTLILNEAGQVEMVNVLSSLFNSSPQVSKQYMTGRMKNALGFDWFSNPLIPVITEGTRDNTTPLVNGASQEGASLVCDGFDASVTVKKGDIFTLASVYAVHPETKTAYDYLQQFVVTADATADGSGNLTLSISPAIISTGAKQNVSAVPADDAALTFAGTASTNYPMNIAFHRDAFAFVSADLPIYKDSYICHIEQYDGISMRLWSKSDIKEDELITRIDVLYGYKTLRPELACRIWG